MNPRRNLLIAALLASCANQIVEICDDSVDNDLDGLIDCADNNCSALSSCIEIEVNPEDCAAFGDEDGNTLSDCEDPVCAAHPFCTPELICGDVIDNDADGATDCFDEDCADSSICNSETCGDNFVDPGEECDRDNLGGFNCVSLGFGGGVLSCADECFFDTSFCVFSSFCGDGLLGADEACDDGNKLDGDGCSSFCTFEFGQCGDGFLSPDEQCDDGNNSNNDGCDELCQLESFISEIEPNEDGAPQPNGDFLNGNDFDNNGVAAQNALNNGAVTSGTNIAAAISPAGDEDVFAVINTHPIPIFFSAETFADSSLSSSCPDIDTVINIRNEFGEILTMNNDGIELCSLVSNTPLEPGQLLFVHVLAFGDANAIPQYFLQIRFQQ